MRGWGAPEVMVWTSVLHSVACLLDVHVSQTRCVHSSLDNQSINHFCRIYVCIKDMSRLLEWRGAVVNVIDSVSNDTRKYVYKCHGRFIISYLRFRESNRWWVSSSRVITCSRIAPRLAPAEVTCIHYTLFYIKICMMYFYVCILYYLWSVVQFPAQSTV